MSTLIVIPARRGATRLRDKPLRLLGGQPLVVRVLERVREMRIGDRVVIATDDAEVAAVVTRHGGEAVLTATSHASGTDRVAEVAARPEFARYDRIVNVQGDEPFLAAEAVRGALGMLDGARFDIGTAAAPTIADAAASPDVVKVIVGADGRALYFSRALIPHLRDVRDAQERAALLRHHIGVYAYTRDGLAAWVATPALPVEIVERLEQLRPLAVGLRLGVAEISGRVEPGVDTESDLVRANERWRQLESLHQREPSYVA